MLSEFFLFLVLVHEKRKDSWLLALTPKAVVLVPSPAAQAEVVQSRIIEELLGVLILLSY